MAWIFTSFGVLMPAIRPPHTVEAGDEQTMQIRTRRKQDLEILRDEYMGDQLGEIIHTPKFDYNYRAYCKPEDFAAAVARIITEIDYEKYKPTIKDRYNDTDLHSVTNSIWGTMCRLGTPWEGLARSGTYKGAWGSGSYVYKGSGSSYAKYADGAYVEVEINGIKKWVWQANDPYDINYRDTADDDLASEGSHLDQLLAEYPSLTDQLTALVDDLDASEVPGLHHALVEQARRDAREDMDEAGLDWHYEESDDDWTPDATNDKANHRPKKGKKKAERQQFPEFSG